MACESLFSGLGAFVLFAYCFVWPITKTIKKLVNGAGHTQCCGNTIIMEIIWWRALQHWVLLSRSPWFFYLTSPCPWDSEQDRLKLFGQKYKESGWQGGGGQMTNKDFMFFLQPDFLGPFVTRLTGFYCTWIYDTPP